MDAQTAYEKFRAHVKAQALKCPKPPEVSQFLLQLKAIGVEAWDGKVENLFTFRHGDKFGFSEFLVNALMQSAYNAAREGYSGEEWDKQAFQRGYDAARKEFAEATGLMVDCPECERGY